MREIKFRIWNDKTKMMYHSHRLDGSDNPLWSWDAVFRQGNTNAPYSHIMQYTNLKDKNGKEIYEGDIINHIFDDGVITGYIEYIEGITAFRFLPFDVGRYGIGPHRINQYIGEVIGNIYENPELLEGESK